MRAAGAVNVVAPSPLAGEGCSVRQRRRMGEGDGCTAAVAQPPHPFGFVATPLSPLPQGERAQMAPAACVDRPRRTWRALFVALSMVTATAMPAAAQTAVDLQLVLAVDASGSVNHYRFELQKQGYVAAFRHARVLQAIRS